MTTSSATIWPTSRWEADDSLVVNRQDRLLHVTLCRTLALNAVDARMSSRLNALWHSVRDDPGVDAIVLSGAGAEAFCIGFDHASRPAVPISPRECGVDKYLVVAVNGFACREGLQLVRDADVVVASAHARFFEPPADGVLRESTRVACDIAPTVRRPITAQQALEIGLVDHVVPLTSLQDTAARLASMPRPKKSTLRRKAVS